MRALVLLGVVLTASVSGFVEFQTRYHEAVGIPTAKKIRAYEEEVSKKESKFERLVVGGVLAHINEHPYYAGLLISLATGDSVCGSSLLSANRLVTAAHCWYDGQDQARQFVVIFGSNSLFKGGTRIRTSKVIVHPQWDYDTLANDIAMIYLPTKVRFSAKIWPISLPAGFELWDKFEEMWGVAVGFGKTSDRQVGASKKLNRVLLQVIPNHICRAEFSNVRSSTICTSGAGGVGICGGDSGGPLALHLNGRPVLIGISSFVAKNNCQGGLPSAFTRVTSHINFIIHHLRTFNNRNMWYEM